MKPISYKGKEYSLHTDIIAISEFCKARGIKLKELRDDMFIEDIDSMIVLFKQSVKRWLRYNGREDQLSDLDFENMFSDNFANIGQYLFDSPFMPKANGVAKEEGSKKKK